MSRFLSDSIRRMAPYTPGEQPQDQQYVKLNTNECPYPPSPAVLEALNTFDGSSLRLYPDPDASRLKGAVAEAYGLPVQAVFAGGGSDEVLAYAFMAFFDRGDKVYFPDVTYNFYKVYADLFKLEAGEIPLQKDFTVDIQDYFDLDGGIFLANPNAPTGICLTKDQMEEIIKRNPERLVVVDEAYVDFAPGMSCVELVRKYDNLLVVQTFSKSRSLAGMRLGFGFGDPALIAGLERVKYSFNPYNLDRVSAEIAIAAVGDRAYLEETAAKIIATRERTAEELRKLGFLVLPSQTNFLFASPPGGGGRELYEKLKARGILVRHFARRRISGFVRISIGSDREMDLLLKEAADILEEEKR